ncbi:DUF58 domain-containing protein [Clostridium amazonitimonense]|uniref:DUF58 domain-containing protein n=1 Tax=Clostridium amazonitimonense TaxID=1499689 RepID=UPI000509CF79|nr:DUF58 domain-containing protein [Clostridium amazonitimonense]
MKSYSIFILVLLAFYIFAEYTRRKGFEHLTIKRSLDKNRIFPGEQFNVITQIDNEKRFPVSFLNIEEEYPFGFERIKFKTSLKNANMNYYSSSYTILGYERIKRYHPSIINKRGVYYLRNISLSLGDIFGFSNLKQENEDFLEIIVYPIVLPAKKIFFENNSIQGDIVVKRWIFSDPIYIRGLREYTRGDRMKDIHWNSSLRMNKLLVKEYEYTSEREVVFVINVQCSKPYWAFMDGEAIERAVDIVTALSNWTIKQGIPTGVLTNANMISYKGEFSNEILPGVNNFKSILEFGARMDKAPKVEFDEFLKEKGKYFRKNSIYIILTPYMNDDIINEIIKLRRYGFMMRIIDISKEGSLPEIDHVEKIHYEGKGEI